jgi:hypothetical protein
MSNLKRLHLARNFQVCVLQVPSVVKVSPPLPAAFVLSAFKLTCDKHHSYITRHTAFLCLFFSSATNTRQLSYPNSRLGLSSCSNQSVAQGLVSDCLRLVCILSHTLFHIAQII